ncbi:hypothetical protein RhiTH_010317 [Rhizoctonia solani]
MTTFLLAHFLGDLFGILEIVIVFDYDALAGFTSFVKYNVAQREDLSHGTNDQ